MAAVRHIGRDQKGKWAVCRKRGGLIGIVQAGTVNRPIVAHRPIRRQIRGHIENFEGSALGIQDPVVMSLIFLQFPALRIQRDLIIVPQLKQFTGGI